MFVPNGTARLFLVAPGKHHLFGTFSLRDGQVSGTGQRGIRYEGRYAHALDGGVDVTVMATIPQGTRIDDKLAIEQETKRPLNFHLTPNQVAGIETASIALKGFGVADVRFTIEK